MSDFLPEKLEIRNSRRKKERIRKLILKKFIKSQKSYVVSENKLIQFNR